MSTWPVSILHYLGLGCLILGWNADKQNIMLYGIGCFLMAVIFLLMDIVKLMEKV